MPIKDLTGDRYVVDVGGHKIPVILSGTYDGQSKIAPQGHLPSIEEIAKGLAALPPSSRKLVKRVNVLPFLHPVTVADPDFVLDMLSNSKTGVIDIYPKLYKRPQEMLDTSLLHEAGHLLSRQGWGTDNDNRGEDNLGWRLWRASVEADHNWPSPYAEDSYWNTKTLDNDFAESYALYHIVKGTPEEAAARQRFPNRFSAIDDLLPH